MEYILTWSQLSRKLSYYRKRPLDLLILEILLFSRGLSFLQHSSLRAGLFAGACSVSWGQKSTPSAYRAHDSGCYEYHLSPLHDRQTSNSRGRMFQHMEGRFRTQYRHADDTFQFEYKAMPKQLSSFYRNRKPLHTGSSYHNCFSYKGTLLLSK